MSEKSDDNETDVKSRSKISSAESNVSDKSRNFSLSHPGSSRSCRSGKSSRSRSPILYSSSENESKENEIDDWNSLNRQYLQKLEDYQREQECYEEEINNYCRLIHSAPLTLQKTQNKVCNLNVIDEIDEENEEVYLSDSINKESIFLSEDEILITPRQKEVPPKKICIRPNTPVIFTKNVLSPQRNVSTDSIEKHESQPNQRVNIGTKTFIIRNTNDAEKRSICTQVENSTSLPHSVDEDSSSNVTLEPNIVVLNKSPCKNLKNCNSPKGDAPDANKTKGKIKNKKKNLTKKKRSWRVKKNAVDCRKSNSSSEISLNSPKNLNVFLTQPIQDKNRLQFSISNDHLKTNTPVSSKNSQDIELKRDDYLNKEYCKEILGDFRLGEEIAINFNDLDLNEDTFKMKGLELIKTPGFLVLKPIGIQNEMVSGNETNGENKIKPLVESRRHQNVDMEFYDVSNISTVTSPRVSLRWNEIFTPNLKLDCKDNEDLGCICLKCFKKKK
ncbi:uncharacterized protein [Onthophagus taurus]|uniref:uncharacterized protein isoform X1 n=1 Tax=Onthophagus taurus TaxID=166361 RepID=UPI0039BE4A74